jgi:hypothetical protein
MIVYFFQSVLLNFLQRSFSISFIKIILQKSLQKKSAGFAKNQN